MKKRDQHPLAGRKVRLKVRGPDPFGKIKDFDEFVVEDWWQNVSGESWMTCNGNPTCLFYATRAGVLGIPRDDEVVYGKIGAYGNLVHISELGEQVREQKL